MYSSYTKANNHFFFLLSPKFARKLRYVSNLQLLKSSIELAPQFIPQRVIDHDRQLPTIQQHVEQQQIQRQKRPLPSLAFGKSLEDLAALEGNTSADFVPKFVVQIVNHIKDHGNFYYTLRKRRFLNHFNLGLDKEGIFRKSPSSEELQSVKTAFNNGKNERGYI